MLQIQAIGATKVHEIIAELSTAARNLLNHLVARCMLHAETSTRVTTESLKPLGLTRRQASYALEVLKKRNLIEHRSERGKRGYEVKLNWGLLGLQVSRSQSQNQSQAQRQPRRQSPPTSPVRTPAPPQNAPQGASLSPRPPQAQPAPAQKVTSPSLPVRPSTSAPPQPAASIPVPIAPPRYRAPLTPERLNHLIANPPASFAALLDEVEPEWRFNTKPGHLKRVERINEEYRPAQLSPWALKQILKPDTNRPASYIPSLFTWERGEIHPGPNTLSNVDPDDPTGAKRAQRKHEEERRRREQERREEEREYTPEEKAFIEAELAKARELLGYEYTPKTDGVSR